MIASTVAYGTLLVFLLLALWEIVQAGGGERRLRKWVGTAAGGLLGILVLGGIGIFLGAEFSAPWKLTGRLFLFGLIAGAPALVFLQAALLNGWRPRKRAIPRPFPLLDALSLGRKGTSLRKRIPSGSRFAEFAVYLLLLLGFTAIWMQIAARFFHPEIHEDLLGLFPEEGEEMDVAFAIALLLPIVLAPFLEEVIYRGYVLDRTVRLLRRRGAARGHFDPAVLAGILLTSALWAVQHSGAISPDWIKWVQIFGVGVVLGAARVRLGLEACIALHLIHNILGGLLLPETLRVFES